MFLWTSLLSAMMDIVRFPPTLTPPAASTRTEPTSAARASALTAEQLCSRMPGVAVVAREVVVEDLVVEVRDMVAVSHSTGS